MSKQVVVGEKSVRVTLYSGADDPDLPSNVKGLPLGIRSRWVSTYNWSVMDAMDDEDAREQANKYTTISIDELTETGVLKELTVASAPAVISTMASVGSGSSAPNTAVIDTPVLSAARTHVPRDFNLGMSVMSPDWKPPVVATATAPGFIERFKEWLKRGDDPSPVAAPSSPTFFILHKTKEDGRLRVLLPYSNNFRDKEQELLTEASHKEYVESAEGGKALYPDLWLWHAGPDTKWGTIETVSYVDGFAVAGGVVDVGKEAVAYKLKEIADKGELAVSFGYFGLRGTDGLYHLYRPFEISPLPVGSEANPYFIDDLMLSGNNKENGMAFSDKKKGWLKTNFGYDDAAIAEAEAKYGAAAQTFKAMGLEFKEDGESAEKPPTPPDPAPVPPPPNPVAPVMGHDPNMLAMVGELAKGLKELKDTVTALADPKAAEKRAEDLVMAKITGAAGGFSATGSAANVVAEKEADINADDFLSKAFGTIGINASGVAAGVGAMVGAVNGAAAPAAEGAK